jgi:hypothetical protein
MTLASVSAARGAENGEFEKFGLESVSTSLSSVQAGAHADFTVDIKLKADGDDPHGRLRDVFVSLPPGLTGNPQAYPRCSAADFGKTPEESHCPIEAQVGITEVTLKSLGTLFSPVYNMVTPGGDVAARIGFFAAKFPVVLDVRLNPETNSLIAAVEGAPAAATPISASTTLWGVPAAPVHDFLRLTPQEGFNKERPEGGLKSNAPEVPFMTNPTECATPKQISVTVRSYQLPDGPSTMTALFPQLGSCGLLGFHPDAVLKPTTEQGTTGTGLDYNLNLPTAGLEHPNLLYDSEMKRAEVILPEGMTINPSEAEGLGVCTEEDLAREAYNSFPGVGCPDTSKIGTVEATTPVIDRNAVGSLFLAKPYDNRFGSLLALYMVLKIPDRGVLVKVAGKVSPNPVTGQLTTIFDDIPQLPVAGFKLHFREGARAPLVTPPTCGSHTGISNFTPWANPSSVTQRISSFPITSGPDHGPCPTGGLPPFKPDLFAGTANNAAGSYSPFDAQISRTDAEQEITHFSLKLPPGLTAKLAGIPFCSDLGIAQAAGRKGPHGGEEELASPSCPAASQVGTTLVGAGVGQVLTYVPGKLYLAGPYNGAPISIASITAAKAGPFDLGTVVVREALRVNPETAEVFVDATGSDPIPHIIQGIPVHLRDVRIFVDRPGFALNPTDCSPTSVASTVLGSGLDFGSEADDRPVTVSTRFQAADCGALPFKPRLKLSLRGSTKRTGHPALRAELRMKRGEANIAETQVTLSHNQFLDQAHIGTVCTRPEFNAGSVPGAKCPKASIYGYARAVTPLLDEPLEGPVYLRSNGGERTLPDLVAALNGQRINVALAGYIDSDNGRIRTTFKTVPDAPVSRFVLNMLGGKKGLLQNSANLCKGQSRAIAAFAGQNGKKLTARPVLHTRCGKGGGKKPSHSRKPGK